MTPDTLRWLHWLVSSQQVGVAAPDAAHQLAAAQQALAEITAALQEGQPLPPHGDDR